MKIRGLVVAGALVLAGSAQGQDAQMSAPDICKVQSDAITAASKEISFHDSANVFSRNTATRSARQGEINTLQANIQNRLTIMNGSGCEPYSGPLSADAYSHDAMACVTASQLGSVDKGTGRRIPKEEACDRSMWHSNPDAV